MSAQSPPPFLSACGLPLAWRGQRAWRILDTGLGDGSNFFTTWQAWRRDANRPRLLHYVAIVQDPPGLAAILARLATFPELHDQSADLGRQWFGLLPGFHRLVLQHGRLMLTLCIGALQPMLREQQFVADSVYLWQPPSNRQHPSWDHWCIKALARLCQRGTAIGAGRMTAALHGEFLKAGFAFDCPHHGEMHAGRYEPRWESENSRQLWRHQTPVPSSCVVVGAGLAGATVAAALARRGWQVAVLDAAPTPAAGASGLPAGLLAPQSSRDDAARSRLSRAGLRLTLQLCGALLQHGEDWARSGVLELRPEGTAGLPVDWPSAGLQWSQPGDLGAEQTTWGEHAVNPASALWHAAAGWIKPARLVQACLAHDGVRFMGACQVHEIKYEGNLWILLDAHGAVLSRAAQLVIASAGDSTRLLAVAAAGAKLPASAGGRLAPMQSLGGQISWATQEPGESGQFPPHPVNGMGSFVPNVPVAGALAWFAGATYESTIAADATTDTTATEAAGHHENFERLARLLPAVARALAQRLRSGPVGAWRGIRSSSFDRLPAVGALQRSAGPTLWVSTAMGSRGLTYAVLCAELIAAQLGAEPVPIEARLSKLLSATRPRLAADR